MRQYRQLKKSPSWLTGSIDRICAEAVSFRFPQLRARLATVCEFDASGFQGQPNVGDGCTARRLLAMLEVEDRRRLKATCGRNVVLRPAEKMAGRLKLSGGDGHFFKWPLPFR
jgi:hypothetical protein